MQNPPTAPSEPEPPVSPAAEMLSGLIDRVVFHNPETGFAVLRVRLQDRREPVTVVGEIGTIRPGELLRAAGRWQTDPSFGHQFRAEALTALPPATADGIAAYLGSGMVKGIGPALAERLVSTFGERVFDVIEREPRRLREVKGVGAGLADRIAEAWERQRAVRDIMLFLHAHGLSALRAARIHETYGARAIEVVSADPFRLARDIRGIGFKAADQLARELGFAHDSRERVRAGLAHVLGEAQADGHCALPRAELIEGAAALLGVPDAACEAALDSEVVGGTLVPRTIEGTACVFLRQLDIAEAEIARRLVEIARGDPPWELPGAAPRIAEAEKALGVGLARTQRDAVERALASRLLVITGGPGTGKTTLVRALLEALPEEVDVRLAAPTGRAARRLAESTGREAVTLHRLLEADPARGFGRGPLRPIQADMLVLDEASMVDVALMQALVLALPDHAALLCVGDVDQLPSIGPGQVLVDTIESGVCPVVRLTEIFRQAAESRIVLAAHRINKGELPDLARGDAGLSDFYAIRVDGPEDAAQKIHELVTTRIPARFGVDPLRDIQVLCPANRGRAGTRTLNTELQQALNPAGEPRLERHGTTVAVGDKVMQTANDYEREVSNGDLGIVTGISSESRNIEVSFEGRTITYPPEESDALQLAYAITVHKAQGSEYPVVVLPLVMQHGRMLRRNLVYTAITRARRLVVLLAEPRALEIAVTERPTPRRWSALRERLQEEAAGGTPA